MEYAHFYDLDHGNTIAFVDIIRSMDRAFLKWTEEHAPKTADQPPPQPKVKRG